MTGALPRKLVLVAASRQNTFYFDILELFARAAKLRGVETELVLDHFPPPEDDVAYLTTHEFESLTSPDSHATESHLARTIVLIAEQPGAPWFYGALKLAERAAVAIDFNLHGVELATLHGCPTRHVPFGFDPTWDRRKDLEPARATDIAVFLSDNERRSRALAELAPVLSRYRARLHIVVGDRPQRPGAPGVFVPDEMRAILAETKILLNIHRDRNHYFEWRRAVGAFANGAVLVTEEVTDSGPFRAGRDFVDAPLAALPHVLEHLLQRPERLTAISASARRTLETELTLESMAEHFADAMAAALELPLPAGPRLPTSATSKPVRKPAPGAAILSVPHGSQELVQSALKRIAGQVGSLEQRLVRLESGPATGPTTDRVVRSGVVCGRPRVSVLITLYNYERFVAEAIRSVARQTLRELELIVIDDCSLDGSFDAAVATLESMPWLDGTVYGRAVNAGLAEARNLGFQLARAPYVFVLDADNAIYPRCLAELADTLDEDTGADAAYAMLEVFSPVGPEELRSNLAWDPERFTQNNYIDAMALFRREVVPDLGGYTSAMDGWEDYDMWCRFVDAERRAVLVPNVLTRYRIGHGSMLGGVNLDPTANWSYMVEAHPFLRLREEA